MKDLFDTTPIYSRKTRFKDRLVSTRNPAAQTFGDFRCLHCRNYVSANPILSGVNNRNHCPYCLWSRHLDLFEGGDRLSACKDHMEPVGLAFKQTRKKYVSHNPGEMMLVHRCIECAKISINRIAADDDPEVLFEVFRGSILPNRDLHREIEEHGIQILQASDSLLVETRLYGLASFARPCIS